MMMIQASETAKNVFDCINAKSSNLERMENTTRIHVSRGSWHFY